MQEQFNPSATFAPWIALEESRLLEAHRENSRGNKHWRKRKPPKNPPVKMGHGGTLDPMATGVLIIGVGKGTKHLGKFLGCTKSYTAEMLFGAATDSYDADGKVVGKMAYAHITRSLVEEKLAQFRGKIMQVPPIFSALKVNGKKLYEYAREGGDLPEVKAREVETLNLDLTDWTEGGKHAFRWPATEAPREEKEAAEKLLHIEQHEDTTSNKRKRDELDSTAQAVDKQPADIEESVTSPTADAKRPRTSLEPAMSGALLSPSDVVPLTESQPLEPVGDQDPSQIDPQQEPEPKSEVSLESPVEADGDVEDGSRAPVARLDMTVTSGFYVRSLVHDLGRAVDSLAHMISLVRTRQAEFEIGKNVLEWEDLQKGEDVWGPKVRELLDEWNAREAEGGDN